MVNPALQTAIEAVSLDERLGLVEYIESTVEPSPIEVTEEQKPSEDVPPGQRRAREHGIGHAIHVLHSCHCCAPRGRRMVVKRDEPLDSPRTGGSGSVHPGPVDGMVERS